MASELKVNTLTGVSTAGSIAVTGEGNSTTTNLQQGLAKMWVSYSCASTTPKDSYNVASLTDNGTGDFTTTFTSAMSNDDYAVPTSSNNGDAGGTSYNLDPHAYATTSVRCDSFQNSTSVSAQLDAINNHIALFGDLA